MLKIIIEILKPILGTSNNIVKNRLLNQHTSKGILILLGTGYLFGAVDEKKLNVIINLLSGTSVKYSDIYLFLFNCAIVYSGYKGFTLVWKRAEKWVEEASFNNENKNKEQVNNDND